MNLYGLIKKFDYKNIIVLDDENYFDREIKDVIDETNSIYFELKIQYGKEILNKKISECDKELLDKISHYAYNPYSAIDEIKTEVNFNYFSSFLDFNINCLEDGNTLWFVDISMGDNNYSHISKLYSAFYNRNKIEKKNDIFILFSSSAKEYNTLEKLVKFLKEKVNFDDSVIIDSYVELNTNVIEKDTFDAKLIYSLILKSSKSKYFDLLNRTIKDSIDNFKQSIYDSEKNLDLFHYDYLTEGKCFDEFLFNVFQTEVKTNYIKQLDYSIFSLMNNAIDYLLEDINIDKEKILWRIAKVMNDFEYPSNIDTSVNFMRHDISFGDVFTFEKKYYMVANQQCDITIRDDGKRIDAYAMLIPLEFTKFGPSKIKKYKMDTASKILLREKENGIINDNDFESINNQLEEKYGFKCCDDETKTYDTIIKYLGKIFNVKYTTNRNLLSFPFWILDNVLCNDDGIVDFSYISAGLRFPIRKRISAAENEYKKIKQEIKDLGIKKFLSLAYYGGELDSIKRIGKLDVEIANKFYKDFLNHQSRTAIDKTISLTSEK